MSNILDSNRLLAVKARYGLAISNGATTNVYLSSRKLERLLLEKLKDEYKYEMDLKVLVEKVVSKIHDVELMLHTIDYCTATPSKQLYTETLNAKQFIINMKAQFRQSQIEELEQQEID